MNDEQAAEVQAAVDDMPDATAMAQLKAIVADLLAENERLRAIEDAARALMFEYSTPLEYDDDFGFSGAYSCPYCDGSPTRKRSTFMHKSTCVHYLLQKALGE